MPDASPELALLQAEYSSVCAEMNCRHGERYKFHALTLGALVVTTAFYSGVGSQQVNPVFKILGLALLPTPYLVIYGADGKGARVY